MTETEAVAEVLKHFADYTLGRTLEPAGITYTEWAERVLVARARAERRRQASS